jgi:hypothetical protein
MIQTAYIAPLRSVPSQSTCLNLLTRDTPGYGSNEGNDVRYTGEMPNILAIICWIAKEKL